MKIGGIVPLSLVDYPGKPALTIFTNGCNLRCPFCHNPELITGEEEHDLDEVLALLKKRAGKLDAVCISGGEPTLQPDLLAFVTEIKNLGYSVKLDTNGSRPEVLAKLLASELLSYVAMDLKTSPQKYPQASGGKLSFEPVRMSLELLQEGKIPFELRTTAVPELVALEDLESIVGLLPQVKLYFLQQFRPEQTLDPAWGELIPYPEAWFYEAKEILQGKAEQVLLRGCN